MFIEKQTVKYGAVSFSIGEKVVLFARKESCGWRERRAGDDSDLYSECVDDVNGVNARDRLRKRPDVVKLLSRVKEASTGETKVDKERN